MDTMRSEELMQKYLDGKCSPEEEAVFESWYNKTIQDSKSPATELDYKALEMRLAKSLPAGSIKLKVWPRYVGIAAAATAIIFGIYFFNYSNKTITIDRAGVAKDIEAGNFGATLTLANGREIKLTDVANGVLAKEAGVVITKAANGALIYEIKDAAGQLNKVNTLSTTKGETYQVHLPDGSVVWLNSASSLSYSAKLMMNGKRMVKLKGEAFFEVAKDSEHPFVVQAGNQEVKVLGTQFNINSYTDEEAVRTTLLEGSVRVTFKNFSQLLKPGQQSTVKDHIEINHVDVRQAIDWKNGSFYFADEDIHTILRKLARWYNIDVVYAADVPGFGFGGEISMKKKLSDVLMMLEATGRVHFKIEGRRVTVMK